MLASRCDLDRVSLASTPDSRWRNNAEYLNGGSEFVVFRGRTCARVLEDRRLEELRAFNANRIAVRSFYELRNNTVNWDRAYGLMGVETEVSTTCPFRSPSVSSTGREAAGRMSIRA